MVKADKIYTWKFVTPESLNFFPTEKGHGTFVEDLPQEKSKTMFLIVAKEGGADDWGAYIDRRGLWNENVIPDISDINVTAASGLKLRRNEAAAIFPVFNPNAYRD